MNSRMRRALTPRSVWPSRLFERMSTRLPLPSARTRTTMSSRKPNHSVVATVPLRRGATNPPAWPGGHAPVLQRDAYPDIGPVVLALPPAEAFRRVEALAAAMGWEIVARAPAEGRLEAVATTEWFGFRDDIVVRVRADGSGSRVDIRSKSRDGQTDLGVNAKRIREFMMRLRAPA